MSIILLIVPLDPFASLFAHATPSARTFFAGNLCTTAQFTECGHLHLLRSGALTMSRAGEEKLSIGEPMLILIPRGCRHRFTAPSVGGADLVCATVEFGGAGGNPIAECLPELIMLPLASHPVLAPVCDLLVAEGFNADAGGRQAALDRLFDYLLILVVRHVVAMGMVSTGVPAGLTDKRLARALTAMHEDPRRAWSVEALGDVAGMSRTRFALHFREIVGRTPLDYLTRWRTALARELLARGKPVKTVAAQVGYDNAAAFSRMFARVTGQSPRAAANEQRV